MKKITTMLVAAFAGLTMTAMAALPATYVSFDNMKLTEQSKQQIRKMSAANKLRAEQNSANEDAMYTRSWTDPRSGNIWNAQLLKYSIPLCELLPSEDPDTKEPFQYTFDEMPYYVADFILTMEDVKKGEVTTQLQLKLCWPSKYIWSQIVTWEGDVDEEGAIPVDKRDYDWVLPNDLCNSKEFCREFRETGGVGCHPNSAGTNWEYFTILPNKELQIDGQVDGEWGTTTYTDRSQTTVKFTGLDQAASNTLGANCTIYFTGESGKTYLKRPAYDGPSRIEGFESQTYNLPEFGDIHIFNAGLGSRDIFGDEDPYTEPWNERSQIYMFAADKYVPCMVDATATKFDVNAIKPGTVTLPEGEELSTHANLFRGYLYTDPKYSKDNTLDPNEIVYSLESGKEAVSEVDGEPYLAICPIGDCFVPSGYVGSWSDLYGMRFTLGNYVDIWGETNSYHFAFGTTEGWLASGKDDYTNTVTAKSTGKIIYHYDENDMQKTREFSAIGTMEYSSVKGVESVNAEVRAANGVITVVAAEAGDVRVFSLNGAAVANTRVAAGEAVNVAADKGVYVVVVNGKAVKVIL